MKVDVGVEHTCCDFNPGSQSAYGPEGCEGCEREDQNLLIVEAVRAEEEEAMMARLVLMDEETIERLKFLAVGLDKLEAAP